ncbi:MAG: 50S ribosomal protein L10 [Deltaproteobacteria bacterium]|nr:50S ribosomal protein L10 [Deltaproteobacteria bacterium]
MNRETKAKEIQTLRDRFGRMAVAVLSDYRGLTVKEAGGLRDVCRDAAVELRVVKNTYLREVAKGTPYQDTIRPHLRGMTVVAWSYEDPTAAAKVITTFAKKHEKVKVKCALLDGRVLEAADVGVLARMPGKDQLRAQLLATFQAPAAQFVRTLAAAPQNFVYLLDAKRRAAG